MTFIKAKEHLEKRGFGDRILEFRISSATVELAAEAVGTEPEKIAKSLTFMVDDKAVMIVCAGDVKVNIGKFKKYFSIKPKMLTREEVKSLVGHDIGGVCPFGINDGVEVFLDQSLKRFDVVYPACGSDKSAVRLTVEELEEACDFPGWVDVCKLLES